MGRWLLDGWSELVRDPPLEMFEQLLQAGCGDLEVVKPGSGAHSPDPFAVAGREQIAPAVAGVEAGEELRSPQYCV